MALDPTTGHVFVATLGGDIFRFDPTRTSTSPTRVYTTSDHGLSWTMMGMTVASDGTMYLVGNDGGSVPGSNIGIIRRGVPQENGSRTWDTVAQTEPYPKSATDYDHNMNAIVLSPDEQFLYVNSGSRTNHGEIQTNGGRFPDVREVPLTSSVLKLPAGAVDLMLPNSETDLLEGGYLFADGFRNTFSLAFDAAGRLFGVENSGDRDDHEELNHIVEGAHYGFPWRMGTEDNPQQFAGYDPGSDLLLNPNAGAVAQGFFRDDPSFPAPPEGTAFTDPVVNLGPDAVLFRDPVTGDVRSAEALGSFTAHRSPLGLVFDTADAMPGQLRGDAFVLSWTGPESPLLGPFAGEGEDLLHLSIDHDSDPLSMTARRIVRDFRNPIDALLIENRIYVLEWGGGTRIWELTFTSATHSEPGGMPARFGLDVYPNPAARQASIRVESVKSGLAVIELYSMLGQRVGAVWSDWLTAGVPATVSMNTDRLAPGVYTVVVRTVSGTASRPLAIY
jgi:hypothetical protein